VKVSRIFKPGLPAIIALALLASSSLAVAADVDGPDTNATSAGAKPIGTTSYAIPANSLYVDPAKGNDSNAGTLAAPVQTVQKAVNKAVDGQTIVLRGGTYHQIGIAINKANLTLQSYPGEAVWLDGSTVVTGWAADGTRWVKTGWTAKFASDPTNSWGAPDNDAKHWRFVKTEPAYRMAAHPDQVWIAGVRQDQVKTLAEVTAGKFYVDYATNKLYLGSNPTGKEVRASDLGSVLGAVIGGAPKGAAITVVSANVTIRGIGVRRYATAVPDQGTIYANADATGLRLENVEIADNATTGLAMSKAKNVTLQSISVHDNGLSGVNAAYADGLTINKASITKNNAESFNVSPVAAGVKVVRSQNVTVTNSRFADNRANGLWFDEDAYNLTVMSNEFSNNRMTGHEDDHDIVDPATGKTHLCDNLAHGLVIELSGTAKVANNRFTNNSADGILIMMSDSIRIWNNTISGSKNGLEITHGTRDPRNWSLPAGYPAQSWVVNNIQVMNNIIGGSSVNLVLLKDNTKTRTGTMGVTLNGNTYYRANQSTPSVPIRGLTQSYANLAAFAAGSGQEAQGIELIGAAPLTAANFATVDLQRRAISLAQALPADIATAMGVGVGEKIIGPLLTKIGALESVSADSVTGWASDPANPNASLTVKFYVFDKNNAQVLVQSVVANTAKAGYGNHGFTTKINWSSLAVGQYRVIPYAVIGASEYQLAGAQSYTVAAVVAPGGNLEVVDANTIKGWAWDPANPSAALTVKVRVYDSQDREVNPPVTTIANIYRADVKNAGYGTGNYGFLSTMNWLAYAPGTYKAVAYAVKGGVEYPLPNPRTFTVQPIQGNLDTVTATTIRAWAWKPDAPNSVVTIKLNIYNSSNTLVHTTSVVANQFRQDVLNAGFGSGNYGLSYAMDWSKLPAGKYRIEAYAIDGSTVIPKLGELTYTK
jgi:parallel beta-helix repeat protein